MTLPLIHGARTEDLKVVVAIKSSENDPKPLLVAAFQTQRDAEIFVESRLGKDQCLFAIGLKAST